MKRCAERMALPVPVKKKRTGPEEKGSAIWSRFPKKTRNLSEREILAKCVYTERGRKGGPSAGDDGEGWLAQDWGGTFAQRKRPSGRTFDSAAENQRRLYSRGGQIFRRKKVASDRPEKDGREHSGGASLWNRERNTVSDTGGGTRGGFLRTS